MLDNLIDWGKLSPSLFREWNSVFGVFAVLGFFLCSKGYAEYLMDALRRENWAGEG